MGRLFGIVLFVLCLWFTAQRFVEVTPVAGGGSSSETIPQQAREKVMDAHEAGSGRRRKLLGE
jgi:hypothetical protein